MNLLALVQEVCDRQSLARPSAVVTSTDRLVRQLFAIANEAGEALSKEGEPGWQSLIAEKTFVTVGQEEQTNAPIPEDLRRFVPGSFFNRTSQREVSGPLTSQGWQLVKARPVAIAAYLMFRERAGKFLITPSPTAGETIAYEYVSSFWAKSQSGQAKARFSSDEDMAYLDDELLILGIIWRFKQRKGLDYGEDMTTYEREVARALGGDGGKATLSMSGDAQRPLGAANVPEGNWPG